MPIKLNGCFRTTQQFHFDRTQGPGCTVSNNSYRFHEICSMGAEPKVALDYSTQLVTLSPLLALGSCNTGVQYGNDKVLEGIDLRSDIYKKSGR